MSPPLPAIVQLRAILQSSDDDAVRAFLNGYTLGSAADRFIAEMTGPGQRSAFFLAIASTYPDDWKAACAMVK